MLKYSKGDVVISTRLKRRFVVMAYNDRYYALKCVSDLHGVYRYAKEGDVTAGDTGRFKPSSLSFPDLLKHVVK